MRYRIAQAMTLAVICALSLGAAAGCGSSGDSSSSTPRQTGVPLGLRSPAFADGGRISARYTCDGEDISPPLTWNRVPADAKSVALVMQDADAPSGALTHWTMWDLSTRSTGLRDGQVPSGAAEGRNDLGKTGYSGPCPPKGSSAHRYVFRLHALNAELGLPAGADAGAVTRAVEQHSIASGSTTATYKR
jgi:Raf kinase inhibitor-like YbhB/YbcL family protein